MKGGDLLGTIGENIRQQRMKRGLTQKELAKLLGFRDDLNGQIRVSEWERGVKQPRADTLKNIASVLKCSVDSLLKER